ncbi:RhoGEF Rgf2 [Coprinopsis cinerea okayama7|uniref:RhoGEF Rgf2 n=1 Tax=Coprinopsis cinerea (strain Okayama-7 / 130 / ATCC MYA-4618 / FGSC 9003) TaxID=240176 RepID=D6RNQ8_COPC7|nr:RhoGEF Rgf2 [Coprinopsis cinerea okayama7\|eukprot:XP_002910870.1 RhoGEF Rgf2 [Coprinopsis cinerea okayama7\
MSISTTHSVPSRTAVENHLRKSSRAYSGSTVDGRNSPAQPRLSRKKVYPALLSLVAEAFRERITLSDRVKDGLTYKAVFDGREAVDKIAYIIKTTDRNLALLLGRALDAQKFFHDVTYDHRLRDSANELYQFRTKLPSPFVSGELPNVGHGGGEALQHERLAHKLAGVEISQGSSHGSGKDASDDVPLPSGVFTLLTECYSPTCNRDQLCYSIACPRRLEQQARLNLKLQPGLSKQISRESLTDALETGSLWIHSVPPELVKNLSDAEKKRQEAINEVIYTERDFVRDLEYLRDVWMKRLREEDIIPIDRREDFLAQVFWNVEDIIAVNTRLRDALNKRQKQYAIVDRIGDVLLESVPHFGPFVSYGAHQLWGKYEFEKEKTSNPAFAHFVEVGLLFLVFPQSISPPCQQTERLPESRKLELNAYLTKPTTRLARYPLLLEAVLKHTPKDSPDKTHLPQVIAIIREFLAKVNAESGKSENRFNLLQLHQQLVFRPGEEMDLRLADEQREMVYKGTLNKRDGEIHTYLFDHALLFTKLVKNKNQEQYKVYRPAIPLELLVVTAADDGNSSTGTGTIRSHRKSGQTLTRRSSFSKDKPSVNNVVSAVTIRGEPKGQYWINFIYLGRRHYHLMLWASSAVAHRKWLEAILKQQQKITEKAMIFDTVPLSEGFFSGPNKVNCAAPYNGGRRVVYGTDDGVYISDLRESHRDPVKVLALLDVTQVDVLEDYQLLIVLSERQVITFPLDALDQNDPMAGLKRAKRISSHTSFFKAGYCLDRVLVCIVKSSQLSSTFKTLEPIDTNTRGRSKPTFKKLLQGGNDTLKIFREFYIPVESTSIHYLKTKLCVGCSKGFEIVDLETLDTQGLLDPHDESLDFVRKKESALRPMAIYRIHNDFLLCYDEFAFYVNKNGRRSRKNFLVQWEGQPTGFALHEPYVLAFEPSFVEIRHVETGMLSQVIQGSNLRLLFADTPPSVTNVGGMHHNPHAPGDAEIFLECIPTATAGIPIIQVINNQLLAILKVSGGTRF